MGLFLAIGVFGRAWVHWRRYGSTGLVLLRGDQRDRPFDLLIGAYALALGLETVAAGTRPVWLQRAALPWSNSPPLLALGVGIGAAALALWLLRDGWASGSRLRERRNISFEPMARPFAFIAPG
jgi:hypothetical protein